MKKKEFKILLVEDELLVAEDIAEILSPNGYSIFFAKNFNQAKQVLEEQKPDLAICDINLGHGPSGIDFAKLVKEQYAYVEIVYLTAFNQIKTIEDAQETHPYSYIVKPYTEEQIKVVVQMVYNFVNERDKEGLVKKLSFAEFRVLKLISELKTSKEIADLLFVSEKTIKSHRHNLARKLSLKEENNSVLKWAIQYFSKK